MNTKIINIKNLKKLTYKLKKQKKIIGMCHGVFDLLHIGHIKHFKSSIKKCDVLIVSVTSDRFVKKGPNRPFFKDDLRIQALAALTDVSYVCLSDFPTAHSMIKIIKPNFYFKGPDYKNFKNDNTGNIKSEVNFVKKYKGKIIYTSDPKYSSSKLLKEETLIFSKDQKKIINYIRKKYSLYKIKKIIDSFENIKPLIVGETIIDQYFFCEALGKSGKDPFLAFRELNNEKYLGGTGYISKHLSSFCKKLFLASYIGKKSEQINFLKKNLPKNASTFFLRKNKSPTIIKKRFLDNNTNSKLFGIYSLNDSFLTKKEEERFLISFKNFNKKSDLTILSDYGHGLITKEIAKNIKKLSKFIAINVQINSSNKGYHSLVNYNNVDCVIINEAELRHEMRSRDENIKIIIKKLAKSIKIKILVVTRGALGVLLYDTKKNTFHECPAFELNAIDKIGAGDAMLSILSLCLYRKLDVKLSLLISSLVAAHSIRTIGNKSPITKKDLLKYLEHIIN